MERDRIEHYPEYALAHRADTFARRILVAPCLWERRVMPETQEPKANPSGATDKTKEREKKLTRKVETSRRHHLSRK